MNFNWSNIIDGFMNARYSFSYISAKLDKIFTAAIEDVEVASILSMIDTALASVLAYLPIIFIALCLIETFFGKKLLGLQKFLLMFGLGFVGGVLIVAPIVNGFFVLPTYITGAVVGLICAILCKLLYWLGYVGVFGYSVYMVCFTGAIPELQVVTVYTQGIQLYSLVAAAVVVIIALLLRKYIEMAGTAALGAYGIATLVIENFYDFTALVPGAEDIVKLAVIAVIAFIGFVVQVKTRKKYY